MSSNELSVVLDRLTAAGRPWLLLAPASPAAPQDSSPDSPLDSPPDSPPEAARGDTTVIDATDLRGAALTIDPFEPVPGCGVQAHADRLLALFDAAFRPPGAVRAVIRIALRRVYTEHGWDLTTGRARPGSVAAPGIPSLAELKQAATAAAGDDPRTRAAVRAFLDAGPGSLWLGPAGYFLAGGHPADVPALLRGNVVFTVGDMADEDGAVFLTGVLLVRLAEYLRTGTAPGPPYALVTAVPSDRLRRLRGLVGELQAYGTEVINARHVPAAAGTATRRDRSRGVLLGRRSAACGTLCRERPCSGYELHATGLLAAADSELWLRLWGQALVLAFVTGRALPRVPSRVRRNWPSHDPRTRECLLATVLHTAVLSRAVALRHSYEPRRLTTAVASTAAALLAATLEAGTQARPIPVRAGRIWVIPQLRWLHEADRLYPPGNSGDRRLRPTDIAPPLDFELAGLPDWPGIRIGERRDGLRRHRLSMAHEPNRAIAATALLGAEPHATGFSRDLAAVAGDTRDLPRWLENVLSWPSWLIKPSAPEAAPDHMPEAVPPAGTG